MYSVAKVFSDSPEKFESTILGILKVLITIWICQIILGVDFAFNEFSIDKFFSNFNVIESIYYVLIAVGIWLLIWEIIVGILFNLMLSIISEIGSSESVFEIYLILTNSAKFENNKPVEPKANIVHLSDAIEKGEAFPFAIKTRANLYFSVGIICFLAITFSDQIVLNWWQNSIAIFFLANFLFASIIQIKLKDFYEGSNPDFKNRLFQLSYYQRLRESLSQIYQVKYYSNIEYNRKKITITPKSDNEFTFKQQIVVYPMFFFDKKHGDYIMGKYKNRFQVDDNSNDKIIIICSNIKLENVFESSNNPLLLQATDEQSMYYRLSELINEITNKNLLK